MDQLLLVIVVDDDEDQHVVGQSRGDLVVVGEQLAHREAGEGDQHGYDMDGQCGYYCYLVVRYQDQENELTGQGERVHGLGLGRQDVDDGDDGHYGQQLQHHGVVEQGVVQDYASCCLRQRHHVGLEGDGADDGGGGVDDVDEDQPEQYVNH